MEERDWKRLERLSEPKIGPVPYGWAVAAFLVFLILGPALVPGIGGLLRTSMKGVAYLAYNGLFLGLIALILFSLLGPIIVREKINNKPSANLNAIENIISIPIVALLVTFFAISMLYFPESWPLLLTSMKEN